MRWFCGYFNCNFYCKKRKDGRLRESEIHKNIRQLSGAKRQLLELKTKFAVTPEVVLDNFRESANQIKKVVEMRNKDFEMIGKFGKEIAVHIPAYEGMKDEVKKLNGAIGLLISEVKKINK